MNVDMSINSMCVSILIVVKHTDKKNWGTDCAMTNFSPGKL